MTTLPHPDYRKQTTDMYPSGETKMKLIQEALSRARMRRPQSDTTPEAHRPARQIAMEARHNASRELGGRRF